METKEKQEEAFFKCKRVKEESFRMSRPRTPEPVSHVTSADAGTTLHTERTAPPPGDLWLLRCEVGRVDGTAGVTSSDGVPLPRRDLAWPCDLPPPLCPHPLGTLAGFPLLSKWGEKKKEREGEMKEERIGQSRILLTSHQESDFIL